jgi:hypothetical protein
VIDLQQTAEDLDSTLTRFKNDGGIALIVQIIESQWPWTVIESKTLQTLSNICSRLKLPVVVDETLTALRCGAPFAHQRPEYLEVINPDFVIFGKGLKANGIGVNFDGETLRALSIYQEGDRYRCAFRWHDKHTRAISVPTLIEALFTLDMARDEDWPLRSIEIGRQIRSAICAQERGERGITQNPEPGSIAGLDALLYVRKNSIKGAIVQGIPEGDYIRLLPVLEDAMKCPAFISNCVMGRKSLARPIECILSSRVGRWRKSQQLERPPAYASYAFEIVDEPGPGLIFAIFPPRDFYKTSNLTPIPGLRGEGPR